MFKISTAGPRQAIEAAWDVLAWSDPTPADAVDAKEDTHTQWRLDAIARSRESAEACVRLIAQSVPQLAASISDLPERDWVAHALEGLPPVHAGRFVVCGRHTAPAIAPGKTKLLIEAGPAFGTGHHGTTRGCLLALDSLLRVRRPGRVLDLGTGTGVLAIAALKSGAEAAFATDIEAESVATAAANAAANRVSRRLHARVARGVGLAELHTARRFDTIFANILARPLVGLAGAIERIAKPDAAVVLSGLLSYQEPQVRRAYGGRGLILARRLRLDGWSSLVYLKQGRHSLHRFA
ncbi:MAG: 50S ribosomal protein L11 methyltransferase [Pseudomonadota bacterium]